MTSICRVALIVVLAAGLVCAEEPAKVVEDGIRSFRKQMRSDDEQVRLKAFDAVMPDRALIEKLFGEDAKLVWPRYEQGVKRMRATTDRAKQEFDRAGDVKAIELYDVRKQDVSGRYKRVLAMIPKDIPVYRAVMQYENGGGGSSSYLVVDGKMRFVQGLEVFPEAIDAAKSGAK